VIPVKTGATGTTSKSFRKHLNIISIKNDIMGLQKTTILSTAHIAKVHDVYHRK
jgi:hypothetical protein